ncbi:MAG: DUF3795 domain-containing protein [Candidatus Zhuqueibacterota bacterium]
MEKIILAPCGIICNICYAFQRKKNRCSGCAGEIGSIDYLGRCRIRNCPEKKGDATLLCSICEAYPCQLEKRIRKRYITKYGEDLFENMADAIENGMDAFSEHCQSFWTCENCGQLLCVHQRTCSHCGAENVRFPKNV